MNFPDFPHLNTANTQAFDDFLSQVDVMRLRKEFETSSSITSSMSMKNYPHPLAPLQKICSFCLGCWMQLTVHETPICITLPSSVP